MVVSTMASFGTNIFKGNFLGEKNERLNQGSVMFLT